MDFEAFIKQEARMECLKILKIMEKQEQTFVQTICLLLKLHKAPEKIITKFIKITSFRLIYFINYYNNCK